MDPGRPSAAQDDAEEALATSNDHKKTPAEAGV
jgi:hypothetical protein